MIIVCPECSTKFKINPDKIPAGGSKVRCARCKTVFAVAKENTKESATPAPPERTESEDQQSTNSVNTDFSYEQFQQLDEQKDTDDFSFGSVDGAEEEKASAPDEITEKEEFSFSEPESQALKATEADPEKLEAKEEPPASENMAAQGTPVAASDLLNQDPDEQEAEQLYQHLAEKKSSPFSSAIRVLLLLILAVLVAVGVFVYINGPDKLNETIQQLIGQQTVAPEPTGQITLANLEGKFLHNEHVGEVFLIRGEAINNFSQARSSIQVKGIIFDQGGQPLLQKTVFCGNPIADEEISGRPFEELEKMMGNQFGKNLSNMKINAKQTIPFDIVFKDLPKNLSEFSVNVTSSKPADK